MSGFFEGAGGWRELMAVNRPSSYQHYGKGALPTPWSFCKVIPNTWSQGIYRLDSMLKSFQTDQGHTQLTLLSVTALCYQVSDCISCYSNTKPQVWLPLLPLNSNYFILKDATHGSACREPNFEVRTSLNHAGLKSQGIPFCGKAPRVFLHKEMKN